MITVNQTYDLIAICGYGEEEPVIILSSNV